MPNERPACEDHVTVLSQPLAPPLFGSRIIRRCGCPANYCRERARPLVLRQQQQMMLIEILLNRQIDFQSRIVVELPTVADYGFTDISEPTAVVRIRLELAENLRPQFQ